MVNQPLSILLVNTQDVGGGAAQDARRLTQVYRAQGHEAWLAVGRKYGSDPNVLPIRHDASRGLWANVWWQTHKTFHSLDGRVPGIWRLSRIARQMADLGKSLDKAFGLEDFHYPGTWNLLQLPPALPQIIHAHNLHGGYFDLRALAWLNQQRPVVLTLHDAWLLGGHCAHSLTCDRWQQGCGQCPSLSLPPAIRRDATAYNWWRKCRIYQQSRLYIATPSQWLMQKVKRSMLAPAVCQTRVIPYGLELDLFRPGNRRQAREALHIPQQAKVLLFAAKGIRKNIWKDYATLRAALEQLAQEYSAESLLLIALGEDGPPESVGRATINFVPYQADPQIVAQYYRAADVYVHTARADTFPNVVLEALACGTPVVATAVGGIPEQIKSLTGMEGDTHPTSYAADQATGILVAPGDAPALAEKLHLLLADEPLRCQLGANAAQDARKRFGVEREAQSFIAWYGEVIRDWEMEQSESTKDRSLSLGERHALSNIS